jgi:glycerophosphoryl diester phosphodiesterase
MDDATIATLKATPTGMQGKLGYGSSIEQFDAAFFQKMSAYGAAKGVSVNYVVELKQGDKNQVTKVLEVLEAAAPYGATGHVVIQSFDWEALKTMDNMLMAASDVVAGQATTEQTDMSATIPKLALIEPKDADAVNELLTGTYASAIDSIGYNNNDPFFNYQMVLRTHAVGKKAFFWTVNTIEDMNFANNINADGYFTDVTDGALQQLESYSATLK